MTMGPDAALLKCDIRNAFSERRRNQILAELFKTPSCNRVTHWAYKSASASV